jgi:acetyltransferase-like isoleucine patch superfamily enzyme
MKVLVAEVTLNFLRSANKIAQKFRLIKRGKRFLHNKVLRLLTRSGEKSFFFPEAKVGNSFRNAQSIEVGKNTLIRGNLQIFPNGGKISIGDDCYIGHDTHLWSMSLIQIGDRVLISHGVNIIDTTSHSKNAKERHKHFVHISTQGHPKTWTDLKGVNAAPIIIEDDVWISYGVSILPGVKIGKGSIIGANSMVTKDVPELSTYYNRVTPIINPLY